MKENQASPLSKPRTFTLGKKIGLVLLIVCIGLTGIIGLVRYMIVQVSQIDEEMTKYNQLMLDAQQIQIWMLEVREAEKTFLLERDLSYKKSADMNIVNISQLIVRINKLPESGGIATPAMQL